MPAPSIKVNKKTGSKTLIVYYTGDNFDQAINDAEQKLGVKGEKMNVLALPAKNRR